MKELENILETNELLLNALPSYQKTLIQKILEDNGGDYLAAAGSWLDPLPINQASFGGEGKPSTTYLKTLQLEFEKFLCGDKQYAAARKKLEASTNKGNDYVIATMAAALGETVGSSAVLIAPVVVLLIKYTGKLSLNAWCELQKEKRKNASE